MAAKSGTAIHPAKNRIKDANGCTKVVQTVEGSNGAQVEIQRRDLTIHYLHAIGKTNAEIAKTLAVHRNLVSRVVTSAPPSVAELTDTLKRLDLKSVAKLEAAIDSDNPDLWWDAVKFYLTRRSILGEAANAGAAGGHGTVINIYNDLKEGLAKLNYGLPSPN